VFTVEFLIDASTVLPTLLREPEPAAPSDAPSPLPPPNAPDTPMAVTRICAVVVAETLTAPEPAFTVDPSMVASTVIAISFTAAAPAPAKLIPLPEPTPRATAPAPASASINADAEALTVTAPERSVLFSTRAFTAATTVFRDPEPAPLPARPTPDPAPAPTAPATVNA
jgi:hypothetical protein